MHDIYDIYNNYKKRLIEINGKNHNIFINNLSPKIACDLYFALKNITIDELWYRSCRPSIVAEVNFSKHHNEINALKILLKEVNEIQIETGKFDLYIGYLFITGQTKLGTFINAPLILAPVTCQIETTAITINHKISSPVIINPNLISLLEIENHIKIDLPWEIYSDSNENRISLYKIIDIINEKKLNIAIPKSKKITKFTNDNISNIKFKNIVVLGRFSLNNPIYEDYISMEKHNLTSKGIEALLAIPSSVSTFKEKNSKNKYYEIYDLDSTQTDVIKKIDSGTNMVIYGPPGTGKSQTIGAIIGNALCKNYRVLVVCQKQVALDVIFSRLGNLNEKALTIPDLENDKTKFYSRIIEQHNKFCVNNAINIKEQYKKSAQQIQKEYSALQNLGDCLYTPTSFGLSLREMYEKSSNVGQHSADYEIYEKLKKTSLIKKNYNEINDAIINISNKKLCNLILKYNKDISINPIIRNIKTNADIHHLKESQITLEKIKNYKPFDWENCKYGRYILAFFPTQNSISINLDIIADTIIKTEYYSLYKAKKLCSMPIFWVAFPIIALRYNKLKNNIKATLKLILKNLYQLENKMICLKNILNTNEYIRMFENVLNGNSNYLKLLLAAIKNYNNIKDIKYTIDELSDTTKEILNFCYENSSKTEASFNTILNKILPLRIYHELNETENKNQDRLKNAARFYDIKMHIENLKANQCEFAENIALKRYTHEYADYCQYNSQYKEYIFQMHKNNPWSVQKFMNYFSEYVLRLFPCWLLSPQNVSNIFPLKKNIFDIIIFDEASQIFIENAIPAIYRGKTIIVAGDNKQLRPSANFMKRYNAEYSWSTEQELHTQSALEATSLLELASAKFTPIHLNYHYRSNFSELINFSNAMFYNNKLQIAPNVTININHPPIERIKVNGIWENRHNYAEAVSILKVLQKIFSIEPAPSIGIITFNLEQKEYIEKIIDKECEKNYFFNQQFFKARHRYENGENKSLFIKNLENVQGDERDIIIFSIGYAKNIEGKIIFHFGALSSEGGENRLNVAITRAKQKIYIITSLEPEEMENVEKVKNKGPKLLKKYLEYTRAVSCGNYDIANSIVFNKSTKPNTSEPIQSLKFKLELSGYCVDINIGDGNLQIPLAIYDKDASEYIMGIDFDFGNNFKSISEYMSKLKFLENKGWFIYRVWSRDWWLSPDKVVDNIIVALKKLKEKSF